MLREQLITLIVGLVSLFFCAFFFFDALFRQRQRQFKPNKYGCIDLGRPLVRLFTLRTAALFFGACQAGILVMSRFPFAVASATCCDAMATIVSLTWLAMHILIHAFEFTRLITVTLPGQKDTRVVSVLRPVLVFIIFLFYPGVAIIFTITTLGVRIPKKAPLFCLQSQPPYMALFAYSSIAMLELTLGLTLLMLFVRAIWTLPSSSSAAHRAIVRRSYYSTLLNHSATFFVLILQNFRARGVVPLLVAVLAGQITITANSLAVWLCIGSDEKYNSTPTQQGARSQVAYNNQVAPMPEISPSEAGAALPSTMSEAARLAVEEIEVRPQPSPRAAARGLEREPPSPGRNEPSRAAIRSAEPDNFWWLFKVRVWGLTRVSENDELETTNAAHSKASGATALPVLEESRLERSRGDARLSERPPSADRPSPRAGSSLSPSKSNDTMRRAIYVLRPSTPDRVCELLARKAELEGLADGKGWKNKAQDVQVVCAKESADLSRWNLKTRLSLRPKEGKQETTRSRRLSRNKEKEEKRAAERSDRGSGGLGRGTDREDSSWMPREKNIYRSSRERESGPDREREDANATLTAKEKNRGGGGGETKTSAQPERGSSELRERDLRSPSTNVAAESKGSLGSSGSDYASGRSPRTGGGWVETNCKDNNRQAEQIAVPAADQDNGKLDRGDSKGRLRTENSTGSSRGSWVQANRDDSEQSMTEMVEDPPQDRTPKGSTRPASRSPSATARSVNDYAKTSPNANARSINRTDKSPRSMGSQRSLNGSNRTSPQGTRNRSLSSSSNGSKPTSRKIRDEKANKLQLREDIASAAERALAKRVTMPPAMVRSDPYPGY
eukprot:g54023.t1